MDNTLIMLDNKALEEVDSFTYIGTIVNKSGGSKEDINSRHKNVRAAYGLLSKVRRSTNVQI